MSLTRIELVARAHHGGSIVLEADDVVEVGRATMQSRGMPPDPHMSVRHFAVAFGNGECRIRDLGSANGTFVNGAPITECTLHDGDVVQAGTTTFVVRIAPDPLPSNSAAASAMAISARNERDAPAVSAAIPASAVQGGATPAVPSVPIDTTATSTFFGFAVKRFVAIGSVRWLDQTRGPRLSIVLKATLTLRSNPEWARDQLPIFNTEIVSQADPRSVRFESDLVPFKPRTDVVLVGRAYAPAGKRITQLPVGLGVGNLGYGVNVFGDREWVWPPFKLSPEISKPRPFTSMDLVYERAFGGIDGPGGMYCKENLVGTGFIGKKTRERIDGLPLPNLEDPRNPITSWDTRPKPVGFGFYGRGWMPRLRYAGTYDEKYMKERHPLPPQDFSYRFFNGAHPDLQVEGYLRGNEDVVLLNVCPQHPEMRFRLPGIVPSITVSRWTAPPEEWLAAHLADDGTLTAEPPLADEVVTPVLDTLVFIPDDGVFYEVFRGVCRLSGLESLEIARITVTA